MAQSSTACAHRAQGTSLVLASMLIALLGQAALATDPPKKVDFNRDIRPILSGRCFACHGPDEDERMGGGEHGLRLDTPSGAVEDLGGYAAIVPGSPDASELAVRIRSKEDYEQMPPPDSGKRLTASEVALIVRWIEQGASYSRHWSYVKPVRPPVPSVKKSEWPKNEIDYFILARLEQEGLAPSPEADRYTLIRRLSLDLTGLPPTIAEADTFATDNRDDAYERLVDRLLASPAYGEHWVHKWLDLARYADSAGYADDPPRTIWAYRDWAIHAINANMPFDQFTIEQIAGDLLPNPTDDQLIATAFHRNTPTNNEGGTNDEEFRNVAVVDRVNTTMAVWMGTTMACAQCHTHKYDPITQEEYFRFFAIFNNTADTDKKDESPTLARYTAEQQKRRDTLQNQIATAEKKLAAVLQAEEAATPELHGPLLTRFVRIELPGKEKILSLAEVQAFRGSENLSARKTATQSSVAYEGHAARAVDGNTDGHYFNANSTTHTKTETDPWWEVDLGQDAAVDRVVIWNRTDSKDIGRRLNGFRIVLLDSDRRPLLVKSVAEASRADGSYATASKFEDFTQEDRDALTAYSQYHSPEVLGARDQIAKLNKQVAAISPLTTPIMQELPEDKRRSTHLQFRGNYQDLGQEVTPGVPAAFEIPGHDVTDRLTLARWLVSEDNPLTARVAVNRCWEQIFGTGLVRTSEDFGSQGDLPSHPELLDWLATEFIRSGWNRKALVKRLVMSATYRQTSRTTDALLQRDPDNRLLARGPRFRLPAEVIRDQALSTSGLLSSKMLGAPVRPPQPSLGLKAAFGGGIDWKTSEGEDRYRRAVYTSWRRSNPYPSMATFGAPTRALCTIRRPRTNTPLQALVTLNDPVYVEAAQALARAIERQEGDLVVKVHYGFRRCLTRPPRDQETAALVQLYEAAHKRFLADEESANRMATNPLGPAENGADMAELASWTVVGNVLLNLDELLMKR